MFKDCPADSVEKTSDLYDPILNEIREYFGDKKENDLDDQYEEIEKVLAIIQKQEGCKDVTMYELATDPDLKQLVVDLGIIENDKILEVLKEDIKKTRARIEEIMGDKENMLLELTELNPELNIIQRYQIFKVLSRGLSHWDYDRDLLMVSTQGNYQMDSYTEKKFLKNIRAKNPDYFEALPSFDPNVNSEENKRSLTNLYDTWKDLEDLVSAEIYQGMRNKIDKMALQIVEQIIAETDVEKNSIKELMQATLRIYEIYIRYTSGNKSETNEISKKTVTLVRETIKKIHETDITDEEKLKFEQYVFSNSPNLPQFKSSYEDLIQIHIERANKVYDEVVAGEEGLVEKIIAGRDRAENITTLSVRGKTGIKGKQAALLDQFCEQELEGIESNGAKIKKLRELKDKIIDSRTNGSYYESYFSGKIRDLYEKEKQEKGSVAERLAL